MAVHRFAHPQERKPPLPYTAGARFQAQEHSPQPPPGITEGILQTSADEAFYRHVRRCTPLELCRKYPPTEGELMSDHIELEIVSPIRAGDDENSQLVRVHAPSVNPSSDLVAKTYDPMYWYFGDAGTNMFLACDAHYRYETMAYLALRPCWGTIVPHYYGSYSISVSGSGYSGSRPVRMILMEHIPGASLHSLSPRRFRKSQRKAIIARVMLAETVLQLHDVLHTDISPRNFVLDQSRRTNGGDIRVCVIDFEDAYVGVLSSSGVLPVITDSHELNRAINLAWRNSSLRDRFSPWIQGWTWNTWLQNVASNYELDVEPAPRAEQGRSRPLTIFPGSVWSRLLAQWNCISNNRT